MLPDQGCYKERYRLTGAVAWELAGPRQTSEVRTVKHRLIYLLTGCQPASWYATPDASCYASLRSTRGGGWGTGSGGGG